MRIKWFSCLGKEEDKEDDEAFEQYVIKHLREGGKALDEDAILFSIIYGLKPEIKKRLSKMKSKEVVKMRGSYVLKEWMTPCE